MGYGAHVRINQVVRAGSTALLLLVVAPGVAHAQANPEYTEPPPEIEPSCENPGPDGSTGGEVCDPPAVAQAEVAPQAEEPAPQVEAATTDWLPVTGSDALGMAAIGAGLVVVGGGVLLARRRSDADATA
ncbi:hypothetical protein BH24ACT3_BH24ACT3_15890 [soil metagenome]